MDGFVYFIEAVGLDAVKIGFSKDVGKRLHALQCANPATLCLLGSFPGGYEDENRMHRCFDAYRLRRGSSLPGREWFRKCPEILRAAERGRDFDTDDLEWESDCITWKPVDLWEGCGRKDWESQVALRL